MAKRLRTADLRKLREQNKSKEQVKDKDIVRKVKDKLTNKQDGK